MLALLLLAAIQFQGGVFRIAGWEAATEPPAGWSSIFPVYAGSGDVPPLLGTYSVESSALVFRPRFPLSPGMHVRALFQPPGGVPIESTFDTPAGAPLAATTRVEHVYPSTAVLPANALKLYVYFSAPMQKGDSWKHLHLLRDGVPVAYPFLEVDKELWDRDQKRFTVLFDPGRIKRGLASLAEAGPALEEGHAYTLVVDRDWLDARGAPMAAAFRKEFRAAAAERIPPNPAKWQVTAPRPGSAEPLVIRFPKPLDYALLQHEIEVTGVSGKVSVDRDETEWRLTPDRPWHAGTYSIVIRTTLEDLAGNHINRPFDVDTFDPIAQKVQADTVTLTMRVK